MDTRTGDSMGEAVHVLPGEEYERLRSRLRGTLLRPGDDGWDRARAAWQLMADQRPDAVVEALDAADVVETVTAARRLGLGVAPQGTGHGAGALGALDGAILLRTARMDSVQIDPIARTATIGAGARWGDVLTRAGEHGLTAAAGMSPTVGVTGYLLGGGLGWLVRSHGLGADSILALDVVDADGRMLTIDAEQYDDLFWAARGGVLPAVVTSVTIRLYEVPVLHAGALMWPLDRAADVAHAWREWIASVPRGVTSLARVLRFPQLPQLPEPLRGRSFVAVEAAVQGEGADALLAPLRALGPEIDSIRPMAAAELVSVHGDPVDPSPAIGEAVLLAEITADAVDALIDVALSDAAGPLVSVELRHLGGAAAVDPARGALSGIAGEGLIYAVGMVAVPELAGPVAQAASAVVERMGPFASPQAVKTFTERPAAASALYGGAATRIREIVAAWDPDGLFRLVHPLE